MCVCVCVVRAVDAVRLVRLLGPGALRAYLCTQSKYGSMRRTKKYPPTSILGGSDPTTPRIQFALLVSTLARSSRAPLFSLSLPLLSRSAGPPS